MQFYNVPIKNKVLLDILDRIVYTYTVEYANKEGLLRHRGDPKNREYHTSEEYLKHLISIGTNHSGFGEKGYNIGMRPKSDLLVENEEYKLKWEQIDNSLKGELGAYMTSLSCFYPPNGYIEWHNNANASAYNVLFTWSETGEGWFKYLDPTTQEIVTVPDPKGWSCKAFYFGDYSDPDNLVYHCASTDCNRLTWALTTKFDEDYWKDLIEHISEE